MTTPAAIPAAWCCTRCDLAGRTCDHRRPSLLDDIIDRDLVLVWHDQGETTHRELVDKLGAAAEERYAGVLDRLADL
jgi:hypothetical protein